MIPTGINRTRILFMDIETIREGEKLEDLSNEEIHAWINTCESRYANSDLLPDELYVKYAALYPEFAKIVCISLGYFAKEADTDFKVKAYYSNSEGGLLEEFSDLIKKSSSGRPITCGHNIKQFDLPFIIRRSVVNSIELPSNFNVYGKKPWDLDGLFVDTREMWASTAFNLGSCSLDNICLALAINSPKELMSGKDVSSVYYKNPDDLSSIGEYCNGDVVATAAVYCKMTTGSSKFFVKNNVY